MDKNEYNQRKAEIIKLHGEPVGDGMGGPGNESARLIHQLKSYGLKNRADELNTKKIDKFAKANRMVKLNEIPIPERFLRQSDLAGFTEQQRDIVKQWMKNSLQSDEQIATSLGIKPSVVKAVMSLEQFKSLELHLQLEFKKSLAFPALARYKQTIVYGDNESTATKASGEILNDLGILKSHAEEARGNDMKLDPETEARLKAAAERYRNEL